jgi:hypothetical protein
LRQFANRTKVRIVRRIAFSAPCVFHFHLLLLVSFALQHDTSPKLAVVKMPDLHEIPVPENVEII